MAIRWQKSSFSEHPDGECMELAAHGEHLLIRESDEPDLVLRAEVEVLHSFLSGAKAGRFNQLQ